MKLRSLLRPGEYLMSRLRFRDKLLLCLAVVTLPLVVFVYTYLNDLAVELQTLEQELRGAEMIVPVMDFMRIVQQHRDAAEQFLNGQASASVRLSAVRLAADQAAAALDALAAAHGSHLPSLSAWHDIRADWGTLVADFGRLSAAESYQRHTDLIDRLLALLAQTADDSYLTLDSQLETYFLMIAATDTFPSLVEHMARQRTIGSGVAARGQALTEDRLQLYALMESVDHAVQRTRNSLARLFQADEYLRARLERPTSNGLAAVTELQTDFWAPMINAQVLTMSSEQVFQRATRAIDAVYAVHRAVAGHLTQRLTDRYNDVVAFRRLLLPTIVGSLVLAGYLLAAFAVPAVTSLRTLEEAARRLAEGDLRTRTSRGRGRDEIHRVMEAVSDTTNTLRELILGVVNTARSINTAAAQLASSSGQSARAAQGATQVVSALAAEAANQARIAEMSHDAAHRLQDAIRQLAEQARRTSADVTAAARLAEEMTQAAQTMAHRADLLAAETRQASQTALDGADVIQRTVGSMQNIRDVIERTAAEVRQLHQLSAKIGEISQLIAAITDQTNLLALNAAIEAARAGEHGRGFAVVADEVRTLAARSAESAKEISRVIADIQSRVEQAAAAMDLVTRQVDGGVTLAGEAGQALEAILGTVEKSAQGVLGIADMADKVRANGERVAEALETIAQAAAANEAAGKVMADSAEEMAAAAKQTATTAESNAAGAEEVASAIQELSAAASQVASSAGNLHQLAADLQDRVRRFQL